MVGAGGNAGAAGAPGSVDERALTISRSRTNEVDREALLTAALRVLPNLVVRRPEVIAQMRASVNELATRADGAGKGGRAYVNADQARALDAGRSRTPRASPPPFVDGPRRRGFGGLGRRPIARPPRAIG